MNRTMPRRFGTARILWSLLFAMAFSLGGVGEADAQAGVSATFDPAMGRLTVTGDATDNRITVSRDVAGTILVTEATRGVAIPVTGGTPTVANTTLIVILGLGGNDQLRLDQANGALPAATMDGGPGNDTMFGGSGVDVFLGGEGNDIVDGNQGADVAFLGAGDDTFIWDPGDGSDTIEGQAGTDTMLFNGSSGAELFEFAANGGRLRFTRNLGNIVMDTDDVERVEVNALGGPDTITVNDLSGTDVGAAVLNLAGMPGGSAGDGQADNVIVNGTNGADTVTIASDRVGTVTVSGLRTTVTISNAEGALDTLTVSCLGGTDAVNAAGLAAGVIQLNLTNCESAQ